MVRPLFRPTRCRVLLLDLGIDVAFVSLDRIQFFTTYRGTRGRHLWRVSRCKRGKAYKFHYLHHYLHHFHTSYPRSSFSYQELLKQLPPPRIALQYYCGEDMYYFDEFQSAQVDYG